MGGTSSIDQAQFEALKDTVNAQADLLEALKSKVDSLTKKSSIEYTTFAEVINKENNQTQDKSIWDEE
jgi:hypothetical protein